MASEGAEKVRSRQHHEQPVNTAFVRALPKAELHAHLSGSISKECLHKIWLSKQANGECSDLEDPVTAIRPGGEFVDVVSFFPLFDKYIYRLVDKVEVVKYATKRAIESFRDDGVVYLELRTTPRVNIETGMGMEEYVAAVSETIHQVNAVQSGILVYLILSIDRKMTLEQANEVVDLAIKHKHEPSSKNQHDGKNYVVGIDLCGNPTKGNVSDLTPAFKRAKDNNLSITLHFAEVPNSSTDAELDTLLSWNPDRLGHVINVSDRYKKTIQERKLGLELCLSCNVLAKLTTGGFAMHHFREWRRTENPIALSTDDVGIFDSPLSNEYLLAARHFDLSREDLIALSKRAADAAFSNRDDILKSIITFEAQCAAS